MEKFKEPKIQKSTNIVSADKRLQELIKLKHELDVEEQKLKQKAFTTEVERQNAIIESVETEIVNSNISRNDLVRKLNNQSSLPDSSCNLM
jgi:hypothetical protein